MNLTHQMVVRETAQELGMTQTSIDEATRAYFAKVIEMMAMNRYDRIEMPDFLVIEERMVSGRTPDGQEYKNVPTASVRLLEAFKNKLKGRGWFTEIDPLTFENTEN